MKTNFLFYPLAIMILIACRKSEGTITQTYSKAIAKYENVDEVRRTNIQGAPRMVTNTGKVFFGDNILLIGEQNKGIHILDNSNPSSPMNVSFIDLPYTNEFYVNGSIIYAISHYDLVKIDISNLSAPFIVARLENAFGDFIKDEDGRILVGFDYKNVTEEFELNSDKEKELRKSNTLYVDYQNEVIPTSQVPSFISNGIKNKGTMNRMMTDLGRIYVVGSSDLSTFQDQGSALYKSSEKKVGEDIETIYTEGDYIYLGSESFMYILDKTDADNPELISEYEHVESCDPVLPNGDVAYVTLRSAGSGGCGGEDDLLEVVNIENPNNPTTIKSIEMNSPYGMTIMQNYLFVAEGSNGLSIFDISNPRNPISVSTASIQTFDVMSHPTNPNVLLVINSGGISQYQFNVSTKQLSELSFIAAP